MKKLYRMSVSSMNHSSDAWCAPACQSVSMPANCAMMLDTALQAVSFSFADLLERIAARVQTWKENMANNL